jgi:hypothetical protein
MHWAARYDLGKPLSLRIVEVARYMHIARNMLDETFAIFAATHAIICVNIVEFVGRLYRIELHAFVPTVHGDCQTRAGGKGAQQEFIWIGASIIATRALRFIRRPRVTPIAQPDSEPIAEMCRNLTHVLIPRENLCELTDHNSGEFHIHVSASRSLR